MTEKILVDLHGWGYDQVVMTANQSGTETSPVWARVAIAAAPVPIVAWLTDFAWFQYGVTGPSFTEYFPDWRVGRPIAVYFRETWIGVVAVAFAAAALALWIYLGYRLVADGSRRSVFRYLGASLVACTALLIVGANVAISIE